MSQVSLVLCALCQSVIWGQKWLLFPFLFLFFVHEKWLTTDFQLLSRLHRLYYLCVVLKNWNMLCHIWEFKIVVVFVQILTCNILQVPIVALFMVSWIVCSE